jgi:hypothetical protein
MVAEQDWCLACGTAAPGRIGGRPGWRPAVTVVSLTVLLAMGAVAAAYAALSGDANRQASAPAPAAVTPVAQTPPVTPPAVPQTVNPAAGLPPAAKSAPKVVIPATPVPSTTISPVAPVVTPITGVPNITVPQTTTPPSSTTTPSTGTQPKTPAPSTQGGNSGLQRVALGADALSLYDPYGNATDKGDPADAQDIDLTTSWFATSRNAQQMGLGLVADLETAKGLRVLTLATSTPGFRIEIYGSDKQLPADVLDTRWAHITDRSRVDQTSKYKNKAGDGAERIVLGGGTHKYRYYLLWLTTPPSAGPTVRISELAFYA